MVGLALDLAVAVARAQSGNQEAFDTIYDRFANPVFRYLYARCGSVEVAEELAGDLWVRVVERLPSFRFPDEQPEGAFVTWMYRIARNLAIDASRRRANGHVPLGETVAGTDVPLDERVIGGENHQELRTAIEKLNSEQREVVVLRFFEERSTAEVAVLTGRTEGAVRIMQHRALGTLARALGVRRGRRTDNGSS